MCVRVCACVCVCTCAHVFMCMCIFYGDNVPVMDQENKTKFKF